MQTETQPYEADVLAQRQQRAAMLREDRSWFTLAGLYWLQVGDNHLGADAANEVVLPAHSAPAHAGVFHLATSQEGSKLPGAVTVQVDPGVTVTLNGQPTTPMTLGQTALKTDSDPAPDYLTLGNLIMVVIYRGHRAGIRLWDTTNPARQAFAGLDWYPIQPALRVVARFVPHAAGQLMRHTDMLGDTHDVHSPGHLLFTLGDQEYRLDAEAAGTRLFFNFRDLTNADTTYPPGRFLFADAPQSNNPESSEVVLDFNLATNPYCAYTAYATCPLPPPQNRLPIRIEAGEKRYGQH